MITKQEAIECNMFHSNEGRNADGSCVRWRRNGKTQTWKTRPDEWRIPVKHGLYAYDSIWHTDADRVHTEESCTNEKGRGALRGTRVTKQVGASDCTNEKG